jgi:hypothetical protein
MHILIKWLNTYFPYENPNKFPENQHRKVARLSAPHANNLYPPLGNIAGTHLFKKLRQFQGRSAAGRITSMENRTNILRTYGQKFLMFLFLYVIRLYECLKRRLPTDVMIIESAVSVMCWVRNWRKKAEHGGEQEAQKNTCF